MSEPTEQTTSPKTGSISDAPLDAPPVEVVGVDSDADEQRREEQQQQEQAERQVLEGMLASMLHVSCNIVVSRWEGAPPVTEAEAAALATPAAALLDYYDVTLAEPWSLWVGLAMTGTAVFAPKYAAHRAYVAQGGSDGKEDSRRDDRAGPGPKGIRQDNQAESATFDPSEPPPPPTDFHP